MIAGFPVYRTYIGPESQEVNAEDRRRILAAIRAAKRRNPGLSPQFFDFVGSVLLLEDPEGLTDAQRHERRQFVLKFQQVTGPVMAKGMEDTAFYRYYPLASLSEVGGDPSVPGTSLEEFHRTHRRADPDLALRHAGHCHPRYQARRGHPRAAQRALRSARRSGKRRSTAGKPTTPRTAAKLKAKPRPSPTKNTCCIKPWWAPGPWAHGPAEPEVVRRPHPAIHDQGDARVQAAEQLDQPRPTLRGGPRTLHRAPSWAAKPRRNSSPISNCSCVRSPTPVSSTRWPRSSSRSAAPAWPISTRVRSCGTSAWSIPITAVGSISRSGGGCWPNSRLRPTSDLSGLVDELLAEWPNQRIKLFLVWRALEFRRAHAELILQGCYLPLAVEGAQADRVCAFARQHDGHWAVTIVPRLAAAAFRRHEPALVAVHNGKVHVGDAHGESLTPADPASTSSPANRAYASWWGRSAVRSRAKPQPMARRHHRSTAGCGSDGGRGPSAAVGRRLRAISRRFARRNLVGWVERSEPHHECFADSGGDRCARPTLPSFNIHPCLSEGSSFFSSVHSAAVWGRKAVSAAESRSPRTPEPPRRVPLGQLAGLRPTLRPSTPPR